VVYRSDQLSWFNTQAQAGTWSCVGVLVCKISNALNFQHRTGSAHSSVSHWGMVYRLLSILIVGARLLWRDHFSAVRGDPCNTQVPRPQFPMLNPDIVDVRDVLVSPAGSGPGRRRQLGDAVSAPRDPAVCLAIFGFARPL
jgi:hypothetical protein